MSFKTAEYKIDNNNSIYYITPVYRIPLIGIEQGSLEIPEVKVAMISESATDIVNPETYEENGVTQETKVYEYQGQYFIKTDTIEKALLYDIYKHPERFLATSRIFTDATLNDGGYKISKALQESNAALTSGKLANKTDSENDDETKLTYDQIIENEKNVYADYVFKRNFEITQDLRFTDGFGGLFSTKREALDSYNHKIKDKNSLKSKYIFNFRNNEEKFDTEYELQKFIREHQAINSKTVRMSSLLNSTNYEKLETVDSDIYFSIFQINYYGELRYFATEEQA